MPPQAERILPDRASAKEAAMDGKRIHDLRALRERKGISLFQAAHIFRLDARTLSEIEAGTLHPNGELYAAMVAALERYPDLPEPGIFGRGYLAVCRFVADTLAIFGVR